MYALYSPLPVPRGEPSCSPPPPCCGPPPRSNDSRVSAAVWGHMSGGNGRKESTQSEYKLGRISKVCIRLTYTNKCTYYIVATQHKIKCTYLLCLIHTYIACMDYVHTYTHTHAPMYAHAHRHSNADNHSYITVIVSSTNSSVLAHQYACTYVPAYLS